MIAPVQNDGLVLRQSSDVAVQQVVAEVVVGSSSDDRL